MAEHAALRPAIFLDRDGVLNRDSPSYVRTPEQFDMLPGAGAAAGRLSRAGFLIVVVTNQSGLARGFVAPDDLARMHHTLRAAVEQHGGRVDGIYYCPHLPGAGCDCRKPSPGLLRRAADELGIDLESSFMVGDKPDDIACGASVGCETILVLSGQTHAYAPSRFSPPPGHVAATLPEAADWILAACPRAPRLR